MPTTSRLLVIDDARAILLAVQAALAEATGQPVDVAASLAEAHQLIDAHPGGYASAVVDLNLPDAPDGEAVDYVLMQGIPVIVLTGNLSESVRDAISQRPIVDYVVKQGVNSINVVCQNVVRLKRNLGRKVLLIDDSGSFIDYLSQVLLPQGVTLLTASTGAKALACFDEHPDIAVALVDFHLPDMDGVQLVGNLRGRFHATQLALIGMTASTEPFVAVRFFKAGANDLLRKPFLDEELVSRFNACLDNLDNISTIAEQANRD
ncbi:MAG: hypothetical protein RL695_2174, partial [Pseudomonadota bacterium]